MKRWPNRTLLDTYPAGCARRARQFPSDRRECGRREDCSLVVCRPFAFETDCPSIVIVLIVLFLSGMLVCLAGCKDEKKSTAGARPVTSATNDKKTPDSNLVKTSTGAADAFSNVERLQVLSLFNRGSALMEQYEYKKAADLFEQVVAKFPNWPAAQFNLGLAYLNLAGQDNSRKSTSRAVEIFEQIVAADPDNMYATFSLGMAYDYLGELDKSLDLFQRVHEADPDDLFVAHKYAEALRRKERTAEAQAVLETIVDRDPGFVSSIYQLASLYMQSGQRDKAKPLFDRFRELNAAELTSGSFVVKAAYGMAGKYYDVMGPDGFSMPKAKRNAGRRIVFSPDVRQFGAPCTVWKGKSGAVGIPALAVADIDVDGDLDVLIGAQDEQGAASWWLNDGQGHFSIGSAVGTGVVAPSVGDLDNDGDTDLWLGCSGPNRALLNDGKGQFTPARFEGVGGPDVTTPVTRLIDLDSDGDLDLVSYGWVQGDLPDGRSFKASAGSMYANNADGSFSNLASKLGLGFDNQAIAAVVCDDFDRDRDLDLMVFPCTGQPITWDNCRVGQFKTLDAETTGVDVSGAISAVTGDPNKDGRRDLLVFTRSGIRLFENKGQFRFEEDAEFRDGLGKLGGTGGQFVDLDDDGDLDIVVGDAHRADGSRGPVIFVNQWPESRFQPLDRIDPGSLPGSIKFAGNASCVAADFTGNGKCDLLLAAVGQPPTLVSNVTPGGHWLSLDLAGKRPTDKKARSPNSAIGARVEIKAGGLYQEFVVGGNCGAVACAPLRVHAGLGDHPKVDWLRIVWPDSVLQGEVEFAADRLASIGELNRKISSCPMLFVWDGHQFRFVADFGGVGGLGYLIKPGVYAEPDPTEYVRIPAMEPIDNEYVLQALTQLEEITYFDEAKLVAVDHPVGTAVYPNEMMAIGAPPPEFRLFCVQHPIDPLKAVDHTGRDVTAQLLHVDRRYAGPTELDDRFTGVAQPHSVELDFGNRLANIATGTRLILFLEGWVEYGYSSTNYAASQAHVELHAPTIEAFREGKWTVLFPEVGYPAGINHMMTLNVTGKILPTDRRIRIRTNMELYWDRIFLGCDQADAGLVVQEVAPRSADFHFHGYPREYSPDGRHPNLYDYANSDPSVGWKLMSGQYTRFGDVRQLLLEPDNCFVIMGHGEELTLRFAVTDFKPLPPGYTRTFILKTDSYCKDMDLYTAFPDTVEPLPFHGMSGYPYRPDEHYPDTPLTREYRTKYNTRRVQGR